MKWVTWEQVGVDRMACAWLIQKYIDPQAEFVFVPVGKTPLPEGAEPFDIPGVRLSHHRGHCTFDTMLREYDLADPVLHRIARIIDEADVSLVFSFSQIALTAGIMAVASLLLFGARPYFKVRSLGDIIVIAIVAGFSVLAWRSAGNTTALNADPIPAISPNDVLCPVLTYVFLGVYGALRHPGEHDVRFEQAQAALTLVSFAVNVITI